MCMLGPQPPTTMTTKERTKGHRSLLFRHTRRTQQSIVLELFIPKESGGRFEGGLISYLPGKAGEWATIDPQWENKSVLSTVDSIERGGKRMVMDCRHLRPCVCHPLP